MTKYLIIHAVGENPNSNWYMWLKGYLIGQKNIVWLPQLPKNDKLDTKIYNKFLTSNKKFTIDEDTVIIGHSTGSTIALSLLQNFPKNKKIKAAVLVSIQKDYLDWNAFDGLYNFSYDFEGIKNHCDNIKYIHSDNDPFNPIENLGKLIDQSNGQLILLKNQGNFSVSYNEKFKKFSDIKEII